jgi:hypothetical protein
LIFRNQFRFVSNVPSWYDWLPSEGLNLAGTIFVEPTPWRTPLDWLPKANLKQLLEELTINITLSMLAFDKLSYVQKMNHTAVEITSTTLVFDYDQKTLLATYGVAIVFALFALGIGAWSFLDNKVSMKIGFLSTLATTRNPQLDDLAKGSCLGAEGTMGELMKLKVKFGDTSMCHDLASAGMRHASFGPAETVGPLHPRDHYV